MRLLQRPVTLSRGWRVRQALKVASEVLWERARHAGVSEQSHLLQARSTLVQLLDEVEESIEQTAEAGEEEETVHD